MAGITSHIKALAKAMMIPAGIVFTPQLLSKIYYLFFICSPGKGDNNMSSDLSEIYQRLESIEADKAPAKAAVILAGLGFTPKMQKQYTKYVLGLLSFKLHATDFIQKLMLKTRSH